MHLLDTDVLVCGGGMSGTVAALAAARAGARVLLVERWAFLGGAATAAAVGQFVGWETAAGRRVIRGIAEEIAGRLAARGAATGHEHFVMSTGHRMDRVSYDPEMLKVLLDEMAVEAGVRVLFHCVLLDVARRDRAIGSARFAAKSGPLEVRPKVAIDASGELDMLARAGAEFLPLAPGESMQPATLMFRFGPIDYARFDAIPQAERVALQARGVAEGALPRLALHQAHIPGTSEGWFNITRVAVDPTDPAALSAGEMEGRRQAAKAAQFLTECVPGCERGRLVNFATQLGIREGRRVRGRYVLGIADLRDARVFPDCIALGAYPLDIHPAEGAALRFEPFGEDVAYAIPFRSLVPEGLDNALVAGRGISCTHEAHAAVRVMPTAMAIGQAAGTAAAMAAASDSIVANVPIAALRSKLVDNGVLLE